MFSPSGKSRRKTMYSDCPVCSFQVTHCICDLELEHDNVSPNCQCYECLLDEVIAQDEKFLAV